MSNTPHPQFPARTVAAGAALATAGTGLIFTPAGELLSLDPAGWWLVCAGGFTAAWATRRHAARRRTGPAAVAHWSRKADRHHGQASRLDLWRTSSSFAMHRRAAVLRPHLAHVSAWHRWRTPTTELATPVARVGHRTVWSPVEDVTLRLGGPRTGKTGELACRIVDAPGAVIATSTRTDLVDLTGPTRARCGPVHVFNPSGLGELPTTIGFDPLAGCATSRTAADRAGDMVGATTSTGTSNGDREWWAGQARDVLTVLLHAAALAGETMHTVAHWVADPDEAQTPVLRALDRSPQAAAMRETALGFFTTNDRTRSSITASIRPALGWLTDATAAAAATDYHTSLDVDQFLRDRGTLYLLGAEDAVVAPLVAALTAELARRARHIATRQPGGRLDPPLTLALDEAALICPVPLDRWTADMGGRNVTIHIGAQSRAQLRQRFGEDGAAAILNNAGTLLIFGGMRDPDDLAAFSTLSGEREETTPTYDADGAVTGSTTRRVPVLTPAQLANLPAGRVLLIRRGAPPSVARVQMAWQRRQVRRTNRRTPTPIPPQPAAQADQQHEEVLA